MLTPTLATLADIKKLTGFSHKVWDQMKLPFANSFDTFIANEALGNTPTKHRVALLWDEGEIVAALSSIPIATDRGPGFQLVLVIVDQDRPDRIALLDYLSLFSGLQAISEKRYAIHTSFATKQYIYGRDTIGMTAEPDAFEAGTNKPLRVKLYADVRDIVAGILKRHPQWRLL